MWLHRSWPRRDRSRMETRRPSSRCAGAHPEAHSSTSRSRLTQHINMRYVIKHATDVRCSRPLTIIFHLDSPASPSFPHILMALSPPQEAIRVAVGFQATCQQRESGWAVNRSTRTSASFIAPPVRPPWTTATTTR